MKVHQKVKFWERLRLLIYACSSVYLALGIGNLFLGYDFSYLEGLSYVTTAILLLVFIDWMGEMPKE